MSAKQLVMSGPINHIDHIDEHFGSVRKTIGY